MDDIFQIEIAQGWFVNYINNLILADEGDRQQLIDRTIYVLRKLEEHNLYIKPEKCEFLVSRVSVLGFVIDNGTVSMEPQKVSGIAEWPPPENVSQLRSFAGFCNFYHRFIDHYADKCEPLNELLKKEEPWEWTDHRHAAFEKLKAAYISSPVLLIPDPTKPFKIKADASLYTSGAVLIQDDTNGDQHPVAYHCIPRSEPGLAI